MAANDWGSSRLAGDLHAFLQEIRLAGFQYRREDRILEKFDAYCAAQGEGSHGLTRPLVDGFCYGIAYEKPSTQYAKERVLRRFGTFLARRGQEAYICPVSARPRNAYQPYIFTIEELRPLFRASDSRAAHPLSTRSRTDPLLFRLVYGCGLRISEALNLQVHDVDVDAGTLTIRQAKNGKDRRIPIAPGLVSRCRQYQVMMYGSGGSTTYFFPNRTGGRLNHTTVYREFCTFLWQAGIPHSGHGPRIHDLRHSYCVHCLWQWVQNGKDLLNALPYLSAYLGHADFRGTEYYLRLTAEVYPDLVAQLEAALGSIIPHGGYSLEDTD